MYYAQLLEIYDKYDIQIIKKLDDYFSKIYEGTNDFSIDTISIKLSIDRGVLFSIFKDCEKIGLLKKNYKLYCPDCGMLLKISDSMSDLFLENQFCIECEENKELTWEDIKISFSLTDLISPFGIRQQEIVTNDIPETAVVKNSDSGISFLEAYQSQIVRNEDIFVISDSEYLNLQKEFENLDSVNNTTQKGRVFNELIARIFKYCPLLRVTTDFQTKIYQIDCFSNFKVASAVGTLAYFYPHIIVECKNEKDKPVSDYYYKVEGYLNKTHSKLGILWSREPAPETFFDNSVDRYLEHKQIVLCFDDRILKRIIYDKENLFNIIEDEIRKIITKNSKDYLELK